MTFRRTLVRVMAMQVVALLLLWLLQARNPGSTAYNVAVGVRLGPDVDAGALRGALERLAARHPGLRTTFSVRGGTPVQRVAAGGWTAFERVDAAGWSEGELERRLAAAAHQPFDLAAGPVLRASLFSRGVAGHAHAIDERPQ